MEEREAQSLQLQIYEAAAKEWRVAKGRSRRTPASKTKTVDRVH